MKIEGKKKRARERQMRGPYRSYISWNAEPLMSFSFHNCRYHFWILSADVPYHKGYCAHLCVASSNAADNKMEIEMERFENKISAEKNNKERKK